MTDTEEDRARTVLSDEERIRDNNRNEDYLLYQNILEDKLTNNMFKINTVIYISTLFLVLIFIFSTRTIVYTEAKEMIPLKEEFDLSLLDFTFVTYQDKSVSNYYSCIHNYTTCDNVCNGFNLTKTLEDFYIACEDFERASTAGILVS